MRGLHPFGMCAKGIILIQQFFIALFFHFLSPVSCAKSLSKSAIEKMKFWLLSIDYPNKICESQKTYIWSCYRCNIWKMKICIYVRCNTAGTHITWPQKSMLLWGICVMRGKFWWKFKKSVLMEVTLMYIIAATNFFKTMLCEDPLYVVLVQYTYFLYIKEIYMFALSK